MTNLYKDYIAAQCSLVHDPRKEVSYRLGIIGEKLKTCAPTEGAGNKKNPVAERGKKKKAPPKLPEKYKIYGRQVLVPITFPPFAENRLTSMKARGPDGRFIKHENGNEKGNANSD